ncbi:MAG TPA: copper resistance protein CopC [Candidatus Dormibacteraeota bacterium]
MPDRQRPGHPDRERTERPTGTPGRLSRLLLAALTGAAALALAPVPALAHASLVAAGPALGAVLPAPPVTIALRFSEPVSAAGPGITVVAPSGRLVGTGPVRVAGNTMSAPFRATGEGTYLVRWQVIAADTHPSRGELTFSIGRATSAPAGEDLGADVGAVAPAGLLLQALARWLHFLGMALAFGVIAFRILVLPDAGPVRAARLDGLAGAGIALLVAAEPVGLAAQAASLGLVAGDLLASSFGRVLGLRLGGALLLWGAAGAVRQAGRGRPALLALGAGVALADGLAGHRIAGLPDAAALALGAVHEAAMAVWVGGLAAVLVTGAGAARFRRVALSAFGVLVLSGAALALAHLRTPGDLAATTYGGVLSVKVAAVGATAVIAGLASRRLEAAALAGTLALAGLLVSLPPPR